MKRILILATLATLLFSSCKHTDKEKAENTRFLVTSPLSKDTLILREYVCQIQSSSHIELRSQEKGYLQNIYVDEGQFVRKGQLMFRIMPLLYKAEMQKARAEKNFAEIEYQNTRSLADSNIVSANELLLSRAKLDKARAELALAQAHLDLTEIRAPFDGIMDRFHKRQGSLVDESELLTTLSDNRKMWVYFNVPEAEYLDYSLRKHSQTEEKVSLQMANKQLYPQNGVVETIEADFNNETGNIAFRAGFPNPNGILRHGETGNILMPVSYKNALIIPQKASFEILDKKYVYVIDKDSTVRSREISVGAEMPHLYVVSSGLQAGDRILLEGLRKVRNNERISYAFVEPGKVISELHELHAE